ncbi:Uncharacterized protein EbC_pEb17200720 (plasmid) [Erwinia billingiae Eb661]|uniref:Uncharacterized protein n=1 Tax=Erwinia billingiae (strain Eb661) TaxID=634500 RepID=D8MJS7_ERWBE|nr:Uncharacterized protein EbC_pEb17200720 [Erwinia billingiae Eb661]
MPSCMIIFLTLIIQEGAPLLCPPVSHMLITVQFAVFPESTVQGHFSWIFYS